MKIYNNLSDLIGNTPLLEASKYKENIKAVANIFTKLEGMNPLGSIKDRVALQMINDAEESGILKENSVVIEPTSGNTGIGLAGICLSRGYKTIFTMPDTMSIERVNLLKSYGAEVVLTQGKKGMNGAIAKANELAKSYENSFIPSQFDNLSNPKAHKNSTAKEIWEDLDGKIDILVAGVGTGGTITGIGEYLKDKNPSIKVVAVEPLTSNVLSGGTMGPHKIQGIGAGFIPSILNTKIYNEIICVSSEEAFKYARIFAKSEGLLCGISSGASLCAAAKLATLKENEGKNIVVILPDGGEKYLSMGLFE